MLEPQLATDSASRTFSCENMLSAACKTVAPVELLIHRGKVGEGQSRATMAVMRAGTSDFATAVARVEIIQPVYMYLHVRN